MVWCTDFYFYILLTIIKGWTTLSTCDFFVWSIKFYKTKKSPEHLSPLDTYFHNQTHLSFGSLNSKKEKTRIWLDFPKLNVLWERKTQVRHTGQRARNFLLLLWDSTERVIEMSVRGCRCNLYRYGSKTKGERAVGLYRGVNSG